MLTKHTTKPLQVGITGGIGSGKSLVAKVFNILGIPVFDSDDRAKYVMTTDGIVISAIKKEFGELSFNPDGTVNRNYIGAIVFKDPHKLAILNSIVHPRVGEVYEAWVREHNDKPYVLKEAALLLESSSAKNLDRIIVVTAPEQLRIKRVLNRDKHRTAQQVRDIISNQMDESEKLKFADDVIANDESRLLVPQILELHKRLQSLEPKTPSK